MKKLISVLLTTAMLISILSVGTSAANVIEGSVSTEIISPENPAHPYLPEPGPNEPNWGSGYNSPHQFITGNAINLIRNAVSSYPLSSYTTTLKTQSDWPDSSDESKSRGVQRAILTVVESTSDKTEVRKTVLVQQCRKKDFAEKFRKACEFLLKSVNSTEKKIAIIKLREEIL